MPRIETVKKARKAQGVCESCGNGILAGAGYRFIKARYGPIRKRHLECPSWRLSEMTTSKMATAYAAQESGHDAIDAIEVPEPDAGNFKGEAESLVSELKTILEEVANGYNECASDYQEGLDNMPDQLQDGDVGQQIQEKIDGLESAAQDLESWDPQDDEPGEDQSFEEWANDVMQEARDAIDALEF